MTERNLLRKYAFTARMRGIFYRIRAEHVPCIGITRIFLGSWGRHEQNIGLSVENIPRIEEELAKGGLVGPAHLRSGRIDGGAVGIYSNNIGSPSLPSPPIPWAWTVLITSLLLFFAPFVVVFLLWIGVTLPEEVVGLLPYSHIFIVLGVLGMAAAGLNEVYGKHGYYM